MSKVAVYASLALCFLGASASAAWADNIPIGWAGALDSNSGVLNAGNGVGGPDAATMNMQGDGLNPASAQYSAFGSTSSSFSSSSLATSLGVTGSMLSDTEFIVFEGNGNNFHFESASFTFNDGSSSLTVNYDYNDVNTDAAVLGRFRLTVSQYSTLFGFTAPTSWTTNPNRRVAFLLIDLDGLDVDALGFSVSISALGIQGNSTGNRTSPDIDAMGLLGRTATPVPEPGTLVLLGLGVLGLAYQRRRRAKARAS